MASAACCRGRSFSTNATYARSIGGNIGATVNGRVEATTGRSLQGVFALYGHGEADSGLEATSESLSYPLPLSSAPAVKVVQAGTASSPLQTTLCRSATAFNSSACDSRPGSTRVAAGLLS